MDYRKEILHPAAELYILQLELEKQILEEKLADEQMKMLNLCCESMTVGFGKEQATLWKESIEKPLLEENQKLKDQVQALVTIMEKYPNEK